MIFPRDFYKPKNIFVNFIQSFYISSKILAKEFVKGLFFRQEKVDQVLGQTYPYLLFRDREHGCSSCGDCEKYCPEESISLKSDENGLKYFGISLDSCTSCSLCVEICPDDALEQGMTIPVSLEDKVLTHAEFYTHCREYQLREKVPLA